MSETYWKAVRPDGTDFWTGTVRWLPKTPLKRPHTVRHPSSTCAVRDHSTSLAVSTDPTNLPGALWPMRLCRVEQVEDIIITDAYKRQSVAWRVVEEVDPSIRFGPQGPHVAALIARAREITGDEVEKFNAARESARDAARESARDAARESAVRKSRLVRRFESRWGRRSGNPLGSPLQNPLGSLLRCRSGHRFGCRLGCRLGRCSGARRPRSHRPTRVHPSPLRHLHPAVADRHRPHPPRRQELSHGLPGSTVRD